MTYRSLSFSTLSPLLLALGLVGGCSEPQGTLADVNDISQGDGDQGDGDVGDGDGDVGDGDVGDGDGDEVEGNGLGCNKMDIVFVVDNSGSMEQEQTLLAQSFPKMIEVLNDYKGGELDYRVAVTNTSFPDEIFGMQVGESNDGMFVKTPEMKRPWLERNDPDLVATFTKIATVGTDGSGQEQPLGAARSAVTTRAKDTNKGFLRENALLAFVILTDEDDGSVPPGVQILPGFYFGDAIPVKDFVGSFDQLTGDRSRWASAVIAGEQDCESNLGEANEAKRLKDFVQQTGDNATFSNICTGNLDSALQEALDTFAVACDEIILF